MTALPPEYASRTVPALLRARRERHGDRHAISGGWFGEFRTLTFAELDVQSSALAAVLLERDLARPGEAVAWAIDNADGAAALVLYHAVLKTGAYNIPLNSRMSAPEIAGLLTHSEASTLITATPRDTPAAGVLTADLPDLLRASASTPSSAHVAHVARETDLASVLYTSGTTGVPKGVEHTHGSSIAAGIAWADCFRMTRADTLQSPFPIVSGAALHFNGLSSLFAGGHFIVDENNPAETFGRVEKFGTTIYVAVPSIYQYWLGSEHLAKHDLSSLRILDYGGSSMASSVAERLKEAIPGVGLMQTYGFTEAGPGGTFLPEEYADSQIESIGVRAAGRHSAFRVVDAEGRDVSPGIDGELIFTGPSVMRGYHRDPEATASVLLPEGGVRSGDIVRFDDDGFLFFVSRKRELIVRGGYNISPVEIENALLAHAAVREAAAYAIPHASLGEVPHAAVVLTDGNSATMEALLAHCATELADFKLPRTILIVDSLPKNPAGKVVKTELQRRALDTARPSAPQNS